MLKIFLSSTFRDLKDARSEIITKLDLVFEGVGMEKFIPDGETSHKNCIDDLKRSDIVIFLFSPNYGSLIDVCKLKEDCKADCIMKTGEGETHQISYTHCEYKTTVAEGILHQTYKVLEGWDAPDVQKDPLKKNFEQEFGKEMWTGIEDINNPKVISQICNNLAAKIVEWYSEKQLNFDDFCNRVEELNEIIKNIEGKVEVYGIGGVGKTALIQVALLIEKLKGKMIITIGTTKTYASGSGFEDFRIKCKKDQYGTESREIISLNDIINAFAKAKLILDPDDLKKHPTNEIIETLSKCIEKEENHIVFIDDFHLATNDVIDLVKSVDHIIFSSRKNTYIARKEICITGIDEEERENLINLFSRQEIPKNVKDIIKQITEGHPVSTELLVKNYQRIDFNKIKDFDLEDANEKQVEDFYDRVVEEIFTSNKDALTLLKNLAILNIDLPTNIHQESALASYNMENVRKSFYELIDTVMLKKKEGEEGIYEFYFKHIQDYLENNASPQIHETATLYYKKKMEILGENIDDTVELLYHNAKSNPYPGIINEFIDLYKKLMPVHYGYKRLIEVGEVLNKTLLDQDKVLVLKYLGSLYSNLRRFKESEDRTLESLKMLKLLEEKYPDFYSFEFANVKYNLGHLFYTLNRFDDSKSAYTDSLEIYRKLAKELPEKHLIDVADTRHALGTIYWKLKNFQEAERIFLEALDMKKSLVEQNPDFYLPKVVTTLNNLGILYDDLRRFEQAEEVYLDALKIEKDLAVKNPELYHPSIAQLQNNLGALYRKLKRYNDAKDMYLKALSIRKKLAERRPETYIPKVAVTLNNLGIVYKDLKIYDKAEEVYIQALELVKQLPEQNPEDLTIATNTLENLGTLYQNQNKFEKAEKMYLDALHIVQNLAIKNPNVYLHDVATTKNDLGTLYRNIDRCDEAEQMYLDALQVREELTTQNPEVYVHELTETQYNLGILYWNLKRFDIAENMCIKALNGYKNLMQKYPDLKRFNEAEEYNDKVLSMNPNYSLAWYNKACIKSIQNDKEKAIEFLAKAIEINRKHIAMAKANADFDPIRKTKEFKALIRV